MNHHFFKTIMAGALAATLILGGAGCKKSPSVVNVSDISLSEESLELKIGETKQLEVSVLPENASDRTVVWGSDNDKIVTVSQEGLVTATGSGLAIVTAATSDGSLSKICKVRVLTKVTALSFQEVDYNRVWGGAEHPDIIEFTPTPETAVAEDFLWEIDDPEPIEFWLDKSAYVRALSLGICNIKVTPKDGDASIAQTIRVIAYKYKFGVFALSEPSTITGDGIEDGASIDMSKLMSAEGVPVILVEEVAHTGVTLVENYEITVEDTGVIKVDKIEKIKARKEAFWIKLPLGTKSGTAKLTIKMTQMGRGGVVLNTYTREFTLLVPESTTTE